MTQQVMALPRNWYQHHQTFLTEFISLGPQGRIGQRNGTNAYEVGPKGPNNDLYRTHLYSQFHGGLLYNPQYRWNTAEVTFRGRREVVLWTQVGPLPNGRVTSLLEQSDTVFVAGNALSRGEDAYSDAYIVREFISKPSVDIMTPVQDGYYFRSVARPWFTTWWRAVSIKGGWRIFGDCQKELIYARMALSQ